jgi:hypothetical protein
MSVTVEELRLSHWRASVVRYYEGTNVLNWNHPGKLNQNPLSRTWRERIEDSNYNASNFPLSRSSRSTVGNHKALVMFEVS